jgi:predicted esterase
MSEIREALIRVHKTARVYTIGEASPQTREAWLVCHGYGQLAEKFVARFDSIASSERIIIAPEGLHRFYLDPIDRSASERRVGATWMTREARAADIADYIEYLEQVNETLLAGAPEASLIGFGFSQGTATITRWAAAAARPVKRLVLWGAGLPPDLDWERAEARCGLCLSH